MVETKQQERKRCKRSLVTYRTKEELYKIMVNRGYVLPSYSSRIITLAFLEQVAEKRVFCPKRGSREDDLDSYEMRRPSSKNMPTIAILVKTIGREIEDQISTGEL